MQVSCLMSSYGRLECLNEQVESFLKQDYKGEKELIILNDAPHIQITFDHPEVKVYNWPHRFSCLGDKILTLTALSRGELIFWWADDDIDLPWRISYCLEKLSNKHFFKPVHHWVRRNGGYERMERTCTFQGVVSRHLWNTLVCRVDRLGGTDAPFYRRLADTPYFDVQKVSAHKLFYILSLEQHHYHMDNYPPEVAWDIIGECVDSSPSQDFRIEPSWKDNYVKRTREAIIREGYDEA